MQNARPRRKGRGRAAVFVERAVRRSHAAALRQRLGAEIGADRLSACCVGTYILLLVAKTPASALICLFLFGLAIAGVNPTAVAAGNALSGAGLGVMLPAAGVGAVLMPYITGAVAQRFGIWAGMLCTVFALMGMTACAVALHRRNDMK